MTHITCRLIAKNRDQLWNPTLTLPFNTNAHMYTHTQGLMAIRNRNCIMTSSSKQVHVQLPTYADNVALPAYPPARRRCCCNRSNLLPVGPTAANLQEQAHAGTDRRLCRQTPYRFIDAAHHHHSGIPDHYSITNINYQSNYQNFNGDALH